MTTVNDHCEWLLLKEGISSGQSTRSACMRSPLIELDVM